MERCELIQILTRSLWSLCGKKSVGDGGLEDGIKREPSERAVVQAGDDGGWNRWGQGRWRKMVGY